MYADGKLDIRLVGSDTPLCVIDMPATEGYILGRSDNASNYMPDIDLLPLEGHRMGVSRRHAALVRYRGTVNIIDLSSSNGTFINDDKLSPDAPYEINSGDKLRLGSLELIVTQLSR